MMSFRAIVILLCSSFILHQSSLTHLHAAELDTSKLPPPATQQIDFSTDIQPILEHSCLRCHGQEKPKSGFRLDSKSAALKGGDNGPDIIPGDSAKSPLIHAVAGMPEDSLMPPKGKGDPLTADQIALLRAWIDQGANWPETAAKDTLHFSASPAFQWITVDGNKQKFRELNRFREGWSGGLTEFLLEQSLDADTRLKLTGSAMANQDRYHIELELKRVDVGFIRSGFDHSRTWFNDVGGFYEPFGIASPRLDRDLHVDSGRAWIDFGLTKPDWPRMTLGYEYQFKEGVKSTLQWGGVTVGGVTKSIYPAFKEMDEHTHIIKFDLRHDWRGTRIEDTFRGEFHDSRTRGVNANFFTFDVAESHREGYRHFQGANALSTERQVNDWLFLSGGYLFSRLSGEGSFEQVTFAPSTGAIFVAPSDSTPLYVVKSSAHVFNVNSRFGPWDGLTFTATLQNDWTRTEGFGNGTKFGFPARVAHTYNSDTDKALFEERFTLRYDKIPHTSLFAEARFRQQSIGQFEQEAIADGFGSDKDYLRDSDSDSDLKDFRGGVTLSPWGNVTFTTSYRRRNQSDTYEPLTDTDLSANSGNGYPALLLARKELTDEVEARLAWRTTRWLRLTLKYELTSTRYSNRLAPAVTFFPVGGAPGGSNIAGDYSAHTYSLNATLTPWKRLYLNSTLNYSETRQISGVNDGVAVAPFKGGTWSAVHSGTFVVDNKTDFTASYTFSHSDYGQANVAALPLGLDYTLHGLQAGISRRVSDNVRTGFQYLFQRYQEHGTGGLNDYTAHGVFATMTWRLN